jgi:hypothetical protein
MFEQLLLNKNKNATVNMALFHSGAPWISVRIALFFLERQNCLLRK